MDALRDLLLDKTLALRMAGEDFEVGKITFLNYMFTVRQLAKELQEILEKWEAVEKGARHI